MPDPGKIRVGDKYQATEEQLPALGDADRTALWEIMWKAHEKQFEDRDRKDPKLEDRRYNVAPDGRWLASYVHIVRGMAVRVKDHGWGVIVGFKDTQNMDPMWKPFLVELMNDDKTKYISETDIEFARISDHELGHISTLKDGYLHSMEFAPWHVEFGETHYYENGQLVRKEFAKDHKWHDQIMFFERGVHVLTEYFENGKHVRSKCHDWDDRINGQIRYFENGKHVRTEFPNVAKDDKYHGEIHYFENHHLVRKEYAKSDGRNGRIAYFEKNKIVRIEFPNVAKDHKYHCQIHYYENGQHVRTEFAKGHPRHGKILYFENGQHVRTEFVSDQPIPLPLLRLVELLRGDADLLAAFDSNTWARFEKHYAQYKANQLTRKVFIDGLCEIVGKQRVLQKVKAAQQLAAYERNGQIRYFENGQHVRTEFAKGHKNYGQISHYVNNKEVRREFAIGHSQNGCIAHYDENGHNYKIEYGEPHNLRLQIRYFEDDGLTRIEFAKDHPRHGNEIHHYKNGQHLRTEFAKGHKYHGQLHFFEKGQHVRTEYPDTEVTEKTQQVKQVADNKRKARDDVLEFMEAALAKEKVDAAAEQAHVSSVMSKEFTAIDLSNSQQLARMANRSEEVRRNYKSPLRLAYDKVKEAMQEFETLAKKAKVIDEKEDGYGSE
jgi:antitoxin component YwqK of YwqJK toxin-antitoxin module